MKIAHLISTFPPHIGGMGKVCFEEANRLASSHEITVITLDYGVPQYFDEKFSFKIRRLKPIFRIGDGGWLINLSRELADFDLVHLHYPFYGAIGSLIAAKKLIGFPFLLSYHMDPQGVGVKRFVQNTYDYFYSRALLNLADRIIEVDHDYFVESKYGKYVKNDTIRLLPNGVDTNIFCPGINNWRELGLAEVSDKKTILFVGNFLPVKNLEFLINILPNIQNDAVLVVVGGGYEEDRLKNIIKNTRYEKKIFFTGPQSDETKLVKYYRAADLIAVPSLSESFSLVALEAMASGGIVLASDIAGVRGRIENEKDGFLAPLNDNNAWKDRINKILTLSSAVRQEISTSARNKAMNLSWDSHATKLEQIYNELID